ncbi:hypothetical protein [Hyphobacterium sp.]|uniref:hypothetical protein n=1 Tax=Hyphobacterium sp. TaxID=2004662 RepID=UPI003BA896CE
MDTATLAIAGYAAVLSTIVFVWQIRASRPRIRLKAVYGFKKERDRSQYGVYLIVTNDSVFKITIRDMMLFVKIKPFRLSDWIKSAITLRRLPSNLNWMGMGFPEEKLQSRLPASVDAYGSVYLFIDEVLLKRVTNSSIDNKIVFEIRDDLQRTCRSNSLFFS